MSVTLIMTWDLKEGMEQEYFEFVVREWVPATNQLGLHTVAAWYTQYRADETVPLIRAEAVAEDVTSIRSILDTEEWKAIHEQLLAYVENYQQKLVETTGEFKI
jgi:hypothetical protein